MQDFVANHPSTEGSGGETAPEASSVVSLDSLKEFQWQGEKLTPERFQEIYNGYNTLSQERQNVEKYRDYVNNYEIDIQNVLEGRASADAFKQIYPREFHAKLEKALGKTQSDLSTKTGIPKEFLNEFGQLKTGYEDLKARLHQMAVESANAKLEATLPRLWEKYPLAVEDAVLARAEGFLQSGGKLTDQVWDRLAKESHEAVSKKADVHYKKQLQTQVNKGMEARDIGPGGATPGKAPPKIKNFDDAREQMIAHLKSQGGF